MGFKFRKHYTRDEARELLPQIREWLAELTRLRDELVEVDQKLTTLLSNGADIGGKQVNRWVRILAELKSVAVEFQKREIQIKDLDRGLIDFPAVIGGKEVFLCWEHGEDDVDHWHDLTSGYSGRERL